MTGYNLPRGAIYLPANEGRAYELGTIKAVFKADEEETSQRYSISEWKLEPHTNGPGAHLHENNHDIFYVLEGTASILIGDTWIEASGGSFVLVPENTTHDFKNTTAGTVKLLNFFVPGGFEHNMSAIVTWFGENKPLVNALKAM